MPAAPSTRWPAKKPAARLDYTWNVKKDIMDACAGEIDPLVSLTLAVKPSGDGEMSASRLSVDETGFRINVWLAAGVPGRDYTVNIDGVTEAGRQFQWPIGIECDRSFAKWPLPAPPCPGYGPVLTWTADGTLAAAGGYVTLSSLGTWPTSNVGLLPGAFYAAAPTAPAFIFAVQGFGHVPAAPVFLNEITAGALLALGATGLPPTDPHVVNQIWINGDIVCVSLG